MAAARIPLRARVGRRVCELREKRGITQAELADRIGMDLRYLRHIELGTTNITIETLEILSEKLNYDPIEFFRPATMGRRKPGRPPTKRHPK